jgi:hypothetical protein
VRDSDWYDVLYAPNSVTRDKYPPAANMGGTSLAGTLFRNTDLRLELGAESYSTSAFGTANHELHRKRRAALSPMFSKLAIQESETLINNQLKQLRAIFEEAAVSQNPLTLDTALLAFTTNTVALFAFNLDLDLMKDAEAAENWHKTIESATTTVVIARQIHWLLPLALGLPRPLVRLMNADICRLLDTREVSGIQEQIW